MNRITNFKTGLVISIFLLAVGCATAAGQIIYVDGDATDSNNDGSSWADAYIYLQDALAAANSGDEIWVAQNTYKPDEDTANPGGTGDRTATFRLKNGVTMKGAYAGFGEPDPNARDVDTYKTILSGDLNADDVEVANPEDLRSEPTRSENSYNVVTGSETDATAVLDGFSITAGNADGRHGYWPDNGGGMYNEYGSPSVINCTFTGNSADWFGGGMYNHTCSPTVANCTFSGNSARYYGGGMCNRDSSPTVTNSTFSGNSTGAWGKGGAMCNEDSNPTLTNCTFSANSAGSGGGMSNWLSSNPAVTNCTFSDNWAKGGGGGMSNSSDSSPVVTNCIFTGNEASGSDGGAMCNSYSSPTVTNCTFGGNTAPIYGGGMYNYGSRSNPMLTNCTFSGNWAGYGGGMANWGGSPTVTNCTFTGNSATYWGGGMKNWDNSSPTLTNCTFSGNSAGWEGGGMRNSHSSPTATSCMFSGNWANDAGGGMCNSWARPTLTNCMFSGNSTGVSGDGGGMCNVVSSNPMLTNCTFSGNWADYGGGMYNSGSSPTTLNNCILWDNTAQCGAQIYNESASSTTITYSDVQGAWPGEGNIDVDPLFADPNNGDYHLKSEAGRWDPNGETWVTDDVTSPCIDRGDPTANYSREPSPNGRRINMGVYGNTPEASKSPSLSETSSAESVLVETVMGQRAVLENVTVSGDFKGTLGFTSFEIISIATGPWAGKGFSKGRCETTFEGISYTGDWQGVVFSKPEEGKIFLKGSISGELSGTVEGYLSESTPGSGIYDRYQATLTDVNYKFPLTTIISSVLW